MNTADGAPRALPAPRTRPGGHRADIQALRALAVVSVVVFHAGATRVAPGGFVGVDVFFVISGFLILRGVGLEVDRTGRFDPVAFLSRRVMRILPMLLLVVTATAVASWFILNPLDAYTALDDLRAAALHYANIHLAASPTGYFAPDQQSPALHLWSISVEEQFYAGVVLIGVLLRMRKVGVWIAVISLVTVASFWLSLTDTSSQAYYWPWTRAWELGIGALLGLLTRHRASPHPSLVRWSGVAIGLSLILAAVLRYDALTPFPGAAALLPVAGAALVIWAGTGTDVARGTTGAAWSAPARLLGDISYSLYLWHWPILVLSAAALGVGIGGWTAVVAVAASVLLAAGTYFVIERPCMRSTVRKSQPGLVIAYGVAGCLIVAALVVFALTRIQTSGSPDDDTSSSAAGGTSGTASIAPPAEAVPADLNPALTEASSAPVYDGDCLGVMELIERPACFAGDVDSDRDVVVFGDSHAAHLMPALDELGAQMGLRVMPFVLNACPSLDIAVDRLPDGTDNPYCLEWRDRQLPAIADLDPELIVISNQTELYTDLTADQDADAATLLEDGVNGMLEALPQDVPVVLVSDSLTWPENPVTCLAENLESASSCSLPLDHAPLYTAQSYAEIVGDRENVTVVDMLELTCADRCYAINGETLIYQDTDHFSQAFMKELTPGIRDTIFADVQG